MSGRNLFDQAQQQFNRVHRRLGSSPLILWLLGGLVLLLWVCGTIVQIQTSEYLALGNQQRVAGVAWGILAQPYLMISGQAPVNYVTAWMYGLALAHFGGVGVLVGLAAGAVAYWVADELHVGEGPARGQHDGTPQMQTTRLMESYRLHLSPNYHPRTSTRSWAAASWASVTSRFPKCSRGASLPEQQTGTVSESVRSTGR